MDRTKIIFWITENGVLDGDTHSVDVWNKILGKFDLKVSQENYNNETSVIHTLSENDFLGLGFTQEEVDILYARIPVRWYAIQNWDWIRCRKVKDGYVVQMREKTHRNKRRLENVLPVGSNVLAEAGKQEAEWLV